jgi:hypothetical protein
VAGSSEHGINIRGLWKAGTFFLAETLTFSEQGLCSLVLTETCTHAICYVKCKCDSCTHLMHQFSYMFKTHERSSHVMCRKWQLANLWGDPLWEIIFSLWIWELNSCIDLKISFPASSWCLWSWYRTIVSIMLFSVNCCLSVSSYVEWKKCLCPSAAV